jgi:hypothetical protein
VVAVNRVTEKTPYDLSQQTKIVASIREIHLEELEEIENLYKDI